MKLFICALAIAAVDAQYGLMDCLSFAGEFESQCSNLFAENAFTGPAGGWDSTTVSCAISGSPSPGQPTAFRQTSDGTEVTSADHEYKLCVSCYDDAGTIMIKVQTNTLPSHCYATTGPPNYPQASNVVWWSVWNPDVTNQLNYPASNFDSETTTTSTLCDIQVTAGSNMNAWSGYTGQVGNIDTWAGIALDGVAIFNGLALGNVDAVETEGDTLDLCLTHSSPQGTIHYHSLGACSQDVGTQASASSHKSTTVVPGVCDNSYNTCLSDPFGFAVSEAWQTTTNYGGVFGLARDGHKIVGPYDANGELWDCSELDMCAGTFNDAGEYVYAPTAAFPHVVGCWGPAPASQYRPDTSCSNLVCTGVNNNNAGASELVTFAAGVFTAALTAVMI